MKRNPGALAKALYSNTPEARNELLFRKGDILTVIEYDYDDQIGWWLCSHRGQRGICPSNYLQLLEDNYSFGDHDNRSVLKRSLSHSGEAHESALVGVEEGKVAQEAFDPQTYDVPRSCVQNLSKSSDPVDEPPLYSNQQPLYQNEEEEFSPFITKTSPLDLYDVPRSQLPIYGQSLARQRRYGHQASESSLLAPRGGITSSLQNVSNFSTSSARSSSSCDLGLPPSGRSNRSSPDNSSNINLAETGTIPGNTAHDSASIISQTSSGTSQVQLRNNPLRRLPFSSTNCIAISSSSSGTGVPINHSNRSSVQSESAESGIGMVSSPPTTQDLYDVPRSTAVRVETRLDGGANGQQLPQSNGTSSRPQSSLSASSSGMGLSIANSDSKDSLDLYDVPRSAKSYVNHMETKYDHVVHNKHQGSSAAGSTASLSRDSTLTKAAHSRHNSTSSVFSAYGYARQGSGVSGADFTDGKRPSGTISQDFGNSYPMNPPPYDNSANDLYDVPRSSCAVPPPNPRTHRGISGGFGASSSASIASSRSVVSLLSDGDLTGSASMLYDVPPSFTKKVSLTDSSETLSFKDSGSESGQSRSDLKLGASSSSLSTPPGRRHNHVLRRGSQGISNNNKSSSSSLGFTGAGVGSADVKILPLGPKAAVSVCEKLRHEVITSIGSILNQVKPKWRSKENLTAIMPDLRFSCCRLSLAIKDISEFATRALSNAKQLGNEELLSKLHRLMTPVINGSQIIQKDVDELEAYFWSADRLSVSPGSSHHESGDALDQLILCARSLKHDVTEISNFLALNSSTLFQEKPVPIAEKPVVGLNQDDGDEYVSLVPTAESKNDTNPLSTLSWTSSLKTERPISTPVPLDARDEQLLEFYSAQIGVTAPLLSQSISTFISAIHQNEPPESFNVHLKYVILFAYRMLFGGDTVHRNIVNNAQLKMAIESRANDLHKSILALYEASKVATAEFPKIVPMQNIVDRVWDTTQAATQLKKVIFNATCATL